LKKKKELARVQKALGAFCRYLFASDFAASSTVEKYDKSKNLK
jgi:hypothetical protein